MIYKANWIAKGVFCIKTAFTPRSLLNFIQFQKLVEHLRYCLQKIGYELDDVCKILAKDEDSSKIENGANEAVSQVRIDVNEYESLSMEILKD